MTLLAISAPTRDTLDMKLEYTSIQDVFTSEQELRESGIIRWYQNCAPLDVEPHHQESFISSYRQERSWEEVFLSMDGIVASGGNTLNQQAIWRAQGIDQVLRQAWDRGIVLGGASAGSLCWFEEGTTDSRPNPPVRPGQSAQLTTQ
mgnify:CR=1 FL=1